MNSTLPARLQNAWAGLAPGERRLILAGGVLLALIFAYLLLWMPLQKQLKQLRVSVPEERAQLARMRTQAATVKTLRTRSGRGTASGAPLSVVEQSATTRGLRGLITRLEPDGNMGVQVTIEGVSFDTLIGWIAELQDSAALVTDSAVIDAQAKPGLVNAKLKLRRGSP